MTEQEFAKHCAELLMHISEGGEIEQSNPKMTSPLWFPKTRNGEGTWAFNPAFEYRKKPIQKTIDLAFEYRKKPIQKTIDLGWRVVWRNDANFGALAGSGHCPVSAPHPVKEVAKQRARKLEDAGYAVLAIIPDRVTFTEGEGLDDE